LLFISPQAVYQSAAFIRKHWPIFPEKCKVAAMGMGTKEALLSEKLPVHLCPEINFSSEGLLATQEMHHVQGKKIALLQGEGGRTLLYDTLCARGAEVTRMVLYRRILPLIDPSFIREQKIDIIVTTSIDILQNFTKILPKKSWAKLYEVPLIVISQKMYDFAHDAGFHQIFIAENAGFNAIMASFTLIRMG
jgi:uroporphyrinogen-III synthase